MTDDLISRNAVIDMLLSEPHNEPRYPDWWVRKVMEIEPRRGKWQITDAYPHNVHCSVCHAKVAQTHWTIWEDGSLPRSFCPNCGAKMEVEHEDDYDYERASDMRDYCERYEPTYNPEDGSM